MGVDQKLIDIYSHVLKHKWNAIVKGHHKGVSVIIMYSPDETDVKTIWLVAERYEAAPVDSSITDRINYEAISFYPFWKS